MSFILPVIGPHTRVDHPDLVCDLLDLVGGVILVQDGLVLLLRGQHHAVAGLDAHGRGTRRDGGQGVLNLDQLARRAEKKLKLIIKCCKNRLFANGIYSSNVLK